MIFLGFTFDPKADDYKVIRFCSIIEFMPFDAALHPHSFNDPYFEAFLNYNNYCCDQKVQIYDLSTDSWRETDTIVPKDFLDTHQQPHCCTSLYGVFYWCGYVLGTNVWAITAYRMFEEVFKRIPSPNGICFECEAQLRILHDSLALIVYKYDRPLEETHVDIWLMDDCGVNGAGVGPNDTVLDPF